MAGRKILIIEDEPDIVELIRYNLEKQGYETDTAGDGRVALEKLHKGNYDLIILDLMLPEIDGLELCRIVKADRALSHLPIIMLTAKSEEVDKVLGLELGADDYVTKPFSPRELLARVKAVLRRTAERPPEGKVVRIGDLKIDKETYRVTKRGVPINLSSTEFNLLLYLAERKGKVFSRDYLLDAVWKGETFVEPRTVDVHIRRLRTQIEDDPSKPVYIKTRRGVGYYMEGEL
jgi:phosphate regulon transcriptional regulator PhoB